MFNIFSLFLMYLGIKNSHYVGTYTINNYYDYSIPSNLDPLEYSKNYCGPQNKNVLT